ncbi:hypothetical protein CYY_005075 [Polysphondylium violaceum]|uniref:Uncharacterized protein n=1 Tax=Polysphondylium violaceum TaxID=133409 RepID=A0A8J4UZW8_9MYCE|nr:hypothetical protein CYY_005075 [Polysphondylium violaceum]
MSSNNDKPTTPTTTTSQPKLKEGCCDVDNKPSQKQKQQQQPKKQQQQQPKKQESSKPKLNTPPTVDMPNDIKYVDSHVHVDQILIRLNKTLDEFPIFQKENYPIQFEKCVQVCCDPVALEYTDMLVQFDPIYAAYGVHPHNASEYTDDIEQKLITRMSHPKTVAWGEMGLDYYYNKSPVDIQKQAFSRQLVAAVQCKKPIVIHSRDAEQDTITILKDLVPKEWKIHIHCFTSSNLDFAKSLLEYFPNLYIGFTGCISFGNSQPIRDAVSLVPIERMLLETDGPYMTPMPFRGQVAHSGHIPLVANVISQVKNIPLVDVLKQCRINTTNVYGI